MEDLHFLSRIIREISPGRGERNRMTTFKYLKHISDIWLGLAVLVPPYKYQRLVTQLWIYSPLMSSEMVNRLVRYAGIITPNNAPTIPSTN